MTAVVFHKLLAIFLTVFLGWVAGRMRWLEQAPGRPAGRRTPRGSDSPAVPDPPASGNEQADPARLLGNVAFYIFVPALLVRTTARLDLATMPWGTVVAFFVPLVVFMLGVYAWQRASGAHRHGAAAPSVRAISASFGNTVQVGIPLATALFGESGLSIHIALISLHAIILLSVLTALVELDLARERARSGQAARLWPMLQQTLRNTIVHPVVLPVLAGLLWNLGGIGLHPVVDETLAALGSAVVPVCLVLIGLTLAYTPLRREQLGSAVVISLLKLLLLPAVVLVVAHAGFGLAGMPLAVVVLMAALPAGSNTLVFSQRYATLEAEATAAIVISTVGFMATASLWLAVLAWLAPG